MRLHALILTWLLAAGPAGRLDEAKPWLGLLLNDKAGRVGIDQVFSGSPAEAAGIHAGDVVSRANGAELTRSADLIHKVLETGVGGTLKLHIVAAGGGERDVRIRLGVRPDGRNMQRAQLVGKAAPDFEIRKATGVYASRLGALKGQVVLLDFWATWCGPCMASLPHLQELHERFAKKGLRVVGVTSDDWGHVEEVVRRRGLTYAQVADTDDEIGARYLITAIPTLVVIGRDGKVVEVSIGDPETIDRAVSALLP